jgi:hypothetical protein
VYLDHNTLAANSNDGVNFYSAKSTNVCMRNNIVANNGGAALTWVSGTTWNTAAECTTPLAAGPVWGNAAYGNKTVCAGACASCKCQPTGLFWPFSTDPAFLSSDLSSAATAYCLGAASFIDAVKDLGYDRNGPSPGNFAGAGPEPGAREAAALGCP